MTSQQADDKLGKLAYDAFMTQRGDFTAPWDGLISGEQDAWVAAARTVEAHVRGQREEIAA